MGWSWDNGFPVFNDDPDFGLPPIDAPEPIELHDFLGWDTPTPAEEATCLQHIANAVMLAYSHTWGRGFQTPNMSPDLRAVVLAMAARGLVNPASSKRIEAGRYVEVPTNPGPTLTERLVLDSWRSAPRSWPKPQLANSGHLESVP